MALVLLLSACLPRASYLHFDLTRAERSTLVQGIRDADVELQDTPLAPEAPLHRDALIRNYLLLGRLDTAQSHLDLLIATCGEGSVWAHIYAEQPVLLDQAEAIIEVNLRRMILGWAMLAEQTPLEQATERAWAWQNVDVNCRTYGLRFPQDPRVDQVREVCADAASAVGAG
ncbi:MAG: hypothetical protein H6739_21405 [Alphaproteobacteria bacterium]|nr:hypothetical protein [Alphaproteobacteria bacterium]